jgi:hypothetical protein
MRLLSHVRYGNGLLALVLKRITKMRQVFSGRLNKVCVAFSNAFDFHKFIFRAYVLILYFQSLTD